MAREKPIGEHEQFLANFADEWGLSKMSSLEIETTKNILLDTIACSIEGSLGPPSKIVQEVITRRGGREESSIIGTGVKVPADMASIVNGTFIRTYDFNDTMLRALPGSGTDLPIVGAHPSENIAPLLAISEREGVSGEEFLANIALGHEITGRLMWSLKGQSFADRGYHQSALAGIVVPVIVGDLLDLSTEEIGNAIGISGPNVTLNIVDNMPHVPNNMMKSLAYNQMAGLSTLGVSLAQEGFTGTSNVLGAPDGYLDLVVGNDRNEDHLLRPESQEHVTKTFFKLYPADSTTQGAVHSMVSVMNENDIDASEIKSIDVITGTRTHYHTRDPNRFFEINEETGDHSLRYLLSVACLDKEVVPEQYRQKRYADSDVREFSRKLNFRANKEYDSIGQSGLIRVNLDDGTTIEKETRIPPGHRDNPLSEEQLRTKFRLCWKDRYGDSDPSNVIQMIENIEDLDDLNELIYLLNDPN